MDRCLSLAQWFIGSVSRTDRQIKVATNDEIVTGRKTRDLVEQGLRLCDVASWPVREMYAENQERKGRIEI